MSVIESLSNLMFLLHHRLFEMEPRAAGVFQFSPGEKITEDPVFKRQARVVVDMIDCAVNFLGPDMDSLTEDLLDLGKRHLRYGVHPDFLPVMAKAIVHTLKTMLGTRFADDDMKAWESILQFMVAQMKIGMAS